MLVYLSTKFAVNSLHGFLGKSFFMEGKVHQQNLWIQFKFRFWAFTLYRRFRNCLWCEQA